MTAASLQLPPSEHPFAEIIHRLEAGGAMLPDTPENLMQIICIYKAYAVPMDFYWRDLLYIAEREFLNPLPFFKYFLPDDYLDRQNSYAGDQSELRVWRGGGDAHPELRAFIKRGETGPWPRLVHHLWHDRINMEFAEACMRAMLWHRGMGGGFDPYLDTDDYRQNCDRAIRAYFKGNPLMLGLYKLYPEAFYEQCRQLSYYSNLGLFWEVMAPVFFEMYDQYKDGTIASVPDAMNFLVNGIFAVASRPIYHEVKIGDEVFELVPRSKGFNWLNDAALPYVEAVFYRTNPFRGTKSYNAQADQIPHEQADFHYGILYADPLPIGSAGIPPTLLMQDMLHFLPDELRAYYDGYGRRDRDLLVQIGVTFQRSMYCVTSAVIQALRQATCYPLDDPDPDHRLKNRQFFEQQLDRFRRPEARLRHIQTLDYR